MVNLYSAPLDLDRIILPLVVLCSNWVVVITCVAGSTGAPSPVIVSLGPYETGERARLVALCGCFAAGWSFVRHVGTDTV